MSTPHLYISSLATWPRTIHPCNAWRKHFQRIPLFFHPKRKDAPLTTLALSSPINTLALSKDSTQILCGLQNGTIDVWDVATGRRVRALDGHIDQVITVSFSSDGRFLLSSSSDKTLRIWNTSTWESLKVMKDPSGPLWAAALSSNGALVFSTTHDKLVRIWDTTSGAVSSVLEGHTCGILSLAISRDDAWVASGSIDKTVRIWDVSKRKVSKVLKGHTDAVWTLAFSRDGSLLLSGSDDGCARVWNVVSGDCISVLQGHVSTISSVTFLDSNICVGASADAWVYIWDRSNGKVLRRLRGHSGVVSAVVVADDRTRIISGSWDKTVSIWDGRTGTSLFCQNLILYSCLSRGGRLSRPRPSSLGGYYHGQYYRGTRRTGEDRGPFRLSLVRWIFARWDSDRIWIQGQNGLCLESGDGQPTKGNEGPHPRGVRNNLFKDRQKNHFWLLRQNCAHLGRVQ